ncbi:MAG: hypothetical protein FJW32_09205 [Acidobacteria bacterium]|nr:hypothetical protein [Acidobacteriota bacterium]
MNKKILVVWALLLIAVGGWAAWYLFAPGTPPKGQPPLGDAAAFRALFERNTDKTRVIAYFSPNDQKDLLSAAMLDAQVESNDKPTLAIYVIWTSAPPTDAMARIPDKRAAQFMDSKGDLRSLLGEGHVFAYARGAKFDQQAFRTREIEVDMPKLRELLP